MKLMPKNFKLPKLNKKLFLIYVIPTILSIAILAVSIQFIYNQRANKIALETSTLTAKSNVVYDAVAGNRDKTKPVSFDPQVLIDETNRVRSENGLASLKANALLEQSAKAKCDDMVARNYWSHNTPDGKKPWIFIDAAGYKYDKSGENLAYGFQNNKDVISGWMNSEGHRKNLLDKEFTEVGFSVCHSTNFANTGDETVVVQHLGTPITLSKRVITPKPKPYVASVCTKTPIPYTTINKDDVYSYTDYSYSYGGYDGYTETCTADSTGYKPQDFTNPPIPKTVVTGTKVKPTAPATQTPPITP